MTPAVEALVAIEGGGTAVLTILLIGRRLRSPAIRQARLRAQLRRAVGGFPRLSVGQRVLRELKFKFTPHGPQRAARALRMRLVNALEQAGASAHALATMDRVDTHLAHLIGRLRELGLGLDKRLILIDSLQDPELRLSELAGSESSVCEVERMSLALASLAAAAAGGSIEIDAAQLRRELDHEVVSQLAGLHAYRSMTTGDGSAELDSSDPAQTG